MNEQTTALTAQIWEDSRVRLKSFIARKIDNEADVEDVLQNVFFKIYRNISELKDPGKLYPWIFQTARRAVIDFYRERKMHAEATEEILFQMAVEAGENDVEEHVLQWLVPMIEELPEKYREALRLTDINGLTQKELAEKLDISVSGAKSRVQRGRERLREILLDCCRLEFNRAGRIVEYRTKKENCRVCAH